MNETRVYLYDAEKTDFKGQDLSAYVLQGDELAERLNNELDTAEITLAGLPRKTSYAPMTKIIMEKVADGEVIATYHFMVDEDTVQKVALSDDDYYDHHISLIEPSVVAQKRLVDNISVTYKLKDVSLETKPAFDVDEALPVSHETSDYTPNTAFGVEETSTIFGKQTVARYGKYFAFSDLLVDGATKKYIKVSETKNAVTITLPKVSIMFGESGTQNFANIGYASIDYSVSEYRLTDQSNPVETISGTIISNSDLSQSTEYAWTKFPVSDEEKKVFLPEYLSGFLGGAGAYYFATQYTDVSADEPSYTISIPVKDNRFYTVSVSLHNFGTKPSNILYQQYAGYPSAYSYTDYSETYFPTFQSSIVGEVTKDIKPSASSMYASFQTYSDSTVEVLYQSSVPYSALDLISKAVVNSGTFEKVSGVCTGDINARNSGGELITNYPFYVDQNFINDLQNTQVIENFYSQKNLWEILIEAGNYIHAIPEIKFGEGDRFMITFTKLGRTDEQESTNMAQSITNFRGVQDYVSSVSSYVTNMVQLGGRISERVAPKTVSEQYLIYNDTVSIVLSKPIIELLEISVRSETDNYAWAPKGETADMTEFVFEENVYKILDIYPTLLPNKGVSLYYTLGDNVIRGCDFRTPTVNTGDADNDYAIKKVIYSAFVVYKAATAAWADVKVNDFTFKATYRTKDSVRVSEVRPDIRKYMKSSDFDKYPMNAQFNNQEDTLVDSVRFGMNVYGKLVRTGNSEYTVVEWLDDWSKVRHKGELYRIDGDLYYAARVHSVCYAGYIESEVTFSKDFNALSSVVGIPSEPRFYEISEQSSIRREVEINDILYLSTDVNDLSRSTADSFRRTSNIYKLMFDTAEYAQYAITAFKGDKDSVGKVSNVYGQPNFIKEIISPLSAYSCGTTLTYSWDMADNYGAGDSVSETTGDLGGTVYRTLQSVPYTDTYGKAPLIDFFLLTDIDSTATADNVRSMPNSWITMQGETRYAGVLTAKDTENRIATIASVQPVGLTVGQTVIYVSDPAVVEEVTRASDGTSDTVKIKYLASGSWSRMVVGYTPIFFSQPDKTKQDIREYWNSIWASTLSFSTATAISDLNGSGLQLMKDNREAVSFNYNTQLATSTDQFVVSPFVFSAGKSNVKVVLLSSEVNKISDGYINTNDIISVFDTSGAALGKTFNLSYSADAYIGTVDIFTTLYNVNPGHFGSEETEYTKVKAIALIYDMDTSGAYRSKFILARNIPRGTEKSEATKRWYIGTRKPSFPYGSN